MTDNPYPSYSECVRDWEQGKPMELLYESCGEWCPRTETADEPPDYEYWRRGHYRLAQQPQVIPYTAETFPRDRAPWVRYGTEPWHVLAIHHNDTGVVTVGRVEQRIEYECQYGIRLTFGWALIPYAELATKYVWADAEHDGEPCGTVKEG